VTFILSRLIERETKTCILGGGRPETRELKQKQTSLSIASASHQQGRYAILISDHILILLFFFRSFVF
jgi:hypothetical protein